MVVPILLEMAVFDDIIRTFKQRHQSRQKVHSEVLKTHEIDYKTG